MKPDLATFRKRFPGLSHLGKADMAVFLEVLDAMEFPAGAIIMAPHYGSGSLYLIDQGSVEVALNKDTERLVLGRFGAGAWFGEMALIDPAPATATVSAEADCNLLILTHEAFVKLRRDHPAVSSKLLQVINEGLAQRLHQTVQYIDGVKSGFDSSAASDVDKRSWFAGLARRIFGPLHTRS